MCYKLIRLYYKVRSNVYHTITIFIYTRVVVVVVVVVGGVVDYKILKHE